MHAFKRGVCFNMCIIVLKKKKKIFSIDRAIFQWENDIQTKQT